AEDLFQDQRRAGRRRDARRDRRRDEHGTQGECRGLRATVMSNVGGTPAEGPEGLRRIPFSAEAEGQIRSLSGWMTAYGAIAAFSGLVSLVMLISLRDPGQLANAILNLLVGTWVIQAASSFKKVATTDEADQAHLVSGFGKLRAIFL